MVGIISVVLMSRRVDGRQRLANKFGIVDIATTGCFVSNLLFLAIGFGVLWCLGLIQEYWNMILVGAYALIVVVWLAGLLLVKLSEHQNYLAAQQFGPDGMPLQTDSMMNSDTITGLHDGPTRKAKSGMCC